MSSRDRSELAFPVLASAWDAHWAPRPDTRDVLNLKSCELQLPAANRLLAEVLAELRPQDLFRYPFQQDLIERFAELNGVQPDSIMLSAGSNSAIGTIVDALAVPAGRLLLQEPVFEGWLHFSALRGVAADRCPGIIGRPIQVSTEALEQRMHQSGPAVVAITNPGNPTGAALPLDEVARLAGLAEQLGHILVVDECYGAFSGISHLPLLTKYRRLIVIRTLSKSWALAGGRLAVTFGSGELIDYLRRFVTDSAVSAPVVAVARRLCDRMGELAAIWQEVLTIRDEFTELVLERNPSWSALPSRTNFVTFDTGRAGGGELVADYLAAHQVRVRSFEDLPGLSGCVRFALADHADMRRVAELLPAADAALAAS